MNNEEDEEEEMYLDEDMEGIKDDDEIEPREEETEDVEEFNSGEEGSARGAAGGINVKQLSSIDEEEDHCDRRTLGMNSVRGGN